MSGDHKISQEKRSLLNREYKNIKAETAVNKNVLSRGRLQKSNSTRSADRRSGTTKYSPVSRGAIVYNCIVAALGLYCIMYCIAVPLWFQRSKRDEFIPEWWNNLIFIGEFIVWGPFSSESWNLGDVFRFLKQISNAEFGQPHERFCNRVYILKQDMFVWNFNSSHNT